MTTGDAGTRLAFVALDPEEFSGNTTEESS
jgi:hypothetical protein